MELLKDEKGEKENKQGRKDWASNMITQIEQQEVIEGKEEEQKKSVGEIKALQDENAALKAKLKEKDKLIRHLVKA